MTKLYNEILSNYNNCLRNYTTMKNLYNRAIESNSEMVAELAEQLELSKKVFDTAFANLKAATAMMEN